MEHNGITYTLTKVSGFSYYCSDMWFEMTGSDGNVHRVEADDDMTYADENVQKKFWSLLTVGGPEGDEWQDFLFSGELPDDVVEGEYGVEFDDMPEHHKKAFEEQQIDMAGDWLEQMLEDDEEMLEILLLEMGLVERAKNDVPTGYQEYMPHELDIMKYADVNVIEQGTWSRAVACFDGDTRAPLGERGCEDTANITDVCGMYCVAFVSKSLNFEGKFVVYCAGDEGWHCEPYDDFDTREKAVKCMIEQAIPEHA